MAFGAAALATALLLGVPHATPAAARPRTAFLRTPDLALHLGPGASDDRRFAASPERAREATPSACLGDVCQPVVAVPGYEPRYGRVHRSELVVLALQRAHVEPLASLSWALVATGLRLDWSPPVLEGPDVQARGWGKVMLRLRVRIDATNHLVFPKRPS
jgi:hypothetical protein